MVIIINGSIGVGKTTISRELNKRLDHSIILEGDYLQAMNPGPLHDDKRLVYLYKTMAHLAEFHKENGYQTFLVNYVFEKNQELEDLIKHFKTVGETVLHTFWLTCQAKEQAQRIIQRNNDQVEWDLNRARELNEILATINLLEFIGEKIDTTNLRPEEVGQLIISKI